MSFEKFIDDHNKRYGANFRKLEVDHQRLFAHLIQLTRLLEMTTSNLSHKKPRIEDDVINIFSSQPLPTDIDA